MANPARNEIEIQLGNSTHLTRPTFEFMAEVEAYFDLPLTTIVIDRLQTGKVKAHEIVAIIAAGIKATGAKVDIDAIRQDVAAAGTVSAINAIIPLLMASFSGAESLKKSQ